MEKFKNTVIEYLQTDRSLTGGRNIYNTLPGKSKALQNSFARMTKTPANLAKLHYQLAKAVGLQERQLKIYLQQPLKKKLAEIDIDVKDTDIVPSKPWEEMTPLEKVYAFQAEEHGYFKAKEILGSYNEKPASKRKEDVFAAVAKLKENDISDRIKSIPEPVKATVKLREQFPFLREANCPDALKLLVNDLITAYETYKQEQPKLHELLSENEAQATVDIVLENYIKNKEAWAELEHYKANGQVLGKHPLFERLALKDEITALKTVDLAAKIKALKINIGRNKKKDNLDLVERDTDLLQHAEEILKKR